MFQGVRQFGSSMKKDVSRIFTVVEEKEPLEDVDGNTSSPSPAVSVTPPLPYHLRKASAPVDSYTPPPHGRLSLPAGAVTPGTLGKVLHDRRLSICAQDETDETEIREQEEPEASIFKHSPEQPEQPKLEPQSFSLPTTFQPTKQRSRSLEEIGPSIKNHGYCGPLSIRGYSFGLPKLNQDDFSPEEKVEQGKAGTLQRLFNSLADPTFPVFRGDGLPISQELFDNYLQQHYCQLNEEGRAQKIKTPEPKTPEKIAKKVDNPVEKLEKLSLEEKKEPTEKKLELNLPTPGKQEIYRRSLSLPLKAIVVNGSDDDMDTGRRKSFVPEHGRMQDVEMTPLSSILSFTENPRTGTPGEMPGFPRAATTPGARVTTPAEFRSFLAETRKKEMTNGNQSSEENGNIEEEMSRAILYVYGHQGMNLLLLLEDQDEADWDLLETLVSFFLLLEK